MHGMLMPLLLDTRQKEKAYTGDSIDGCAFAAAGWTADPYAAVAQRHSCGVYSVFVLAQQVIVHPPAYAVLQRKNAVSATRIRCSLPPARGMHKPHMIANQCSIVMSCFCQLFSNPQQGNAASIPNIKESF